MQLSYATTMCNNYSRDRTTLLLPDSHTKYISSTNEESLSTNHIYSQSFSEFLNGLFVSALIRHAQTFVSLLR